MNRKILALSLVTLAAPASAEDYCAPSPERFCAQLTDPAYYYFDAINYDGVPPELLDRWLEIATGQYALTLDPEEEAATKAIIAGLGASIRSGEKTKLEAIASLFNACVEENQHLRK